jgi:hypothetical protein
VNLAGDEQLALAIDEQLAGIERHSGRLLAQAQKRMRNDAAACDGRRACAFQECAALKTGNVQSHFVLSSC